MNYWGFVFAGFFGLIAGKIAYNCFIEPLINTLKKIREDKRKKKEEKNSLPEMTMEDLQKWFDEQSFLQMIRDYANGNDVPALIKQENQTNYVELTVPCTGNSCPCSPANSDCCETYSQGICKVKLNISKLCGVEEVETNSNVLTSEEIKQFGEYAEKLYKLTHKDCEE